MFLTLPPSGTSLYQKGRLFVKQLRALNKRENDSTSPKCPLLLKGTSEAGGVRYNEIEYETINNSLKSKTISKFSS